LTLITDDAVGLDADMRKAAAIGTEIPLPPDHIIKVAASAEKFNFTPDIYHKPPVRTSLLRVKRFRMPFQLGKSAGSRRSSSMSFARSIRED
jgi:hypothetical protein